MRQLGIAMCAIGASVTVAIFISIPDDPYLLIWGFTSDMVGSVVCLAGLLLIALSDEQYWADHQQSHDTNLRRETGQRRKPVIQERWIAQIFCSDHREPARMVLRVRDIGLTAQVMPENKVAVGPFDSIERATLARHQLANELRVYAELTQLRETL